MSDDPQLTVAELLARAQKENPGAESSRRRRRRSLDEGGVSVAELTGSLRRVEARPQESKHSSVPIDPVEETIDSGSSVDTGSSVDKPAAPAPAPEPAETTVIKKVEVPEDTRPATPATSWSKFERPAAVQEQDPVEATGEIPVVEQDPAAEPEYEMASAAEESATVNPILLVVFVFLGLLAGVLGFLAFQWVWANLPAAAAIVLALVVTALVVAGVRAMRTGRDAVTMTLAGIAGLAVTCGPGVVAAF